MEQKHVERFWKYVNKTESCWLWTAGNGGKKAYGKFHIWPKTYNAHRVSWELANGPIPDGLCVLHKCDVPLCVNPEHLFLGTKADNNADMMRKGRKYDGPRGRWGQDPHRPPPTGELSHMWRQPLKCIHRKLDWDRVRKLRAEYAAGESVRVLRRRYGISQVATNNIIAERTWKVSV